MCYLCTQITVNRTPYISIVALLCATSAQGQTIVQRLKSRGAGQGVVNVYQSDSVSAVVNGKPAKQSSATAASTSVRTTPRLTPASPATVRSGEKSAPASKTTREEPKGSLNVQGKGGQGKAEQVFSVPVAPQESTDSMATLSRTALRGGHKVSGYRVQAYAGGNSRANRRQAENVRARVKQVLPMEPVYVHFLSPRWVCRVGNYRTYAEAQQVLRQLRDELDIQGANIVKCQIVVKEEP